MVMDKYYPEDHLHELWKKINSLHLSYLAMEESPQKLEHRNKLEGCINNFLCHVPHDRKFELRETSLVLYNSASSKNDFSGYKAALGWDAIGRYAANLITKPWRREYRQIKMYSGFYKHEIESNLVSAEIMFGAMGYRQASEEVLILDGPICPDRVTSVSLDSMIAYVECQILKAIWEEVSSLNISWLEVLKFRESHLCSPKQSVSSLIYMHHQRQYQDKVQSYPIMDIPPPMCNNIKMQHHNMQQIPMYPTMQMPSHVPHMTAPPCMHTSNGCCGNYMTYNPHQYASYMPVNYVPIKAPQQYMGTYKYNSVPTAQLIELDQHTYDTPDSPAIHNRRYDYDEAERKMRHMYVAPESKKTVSEPKLSDRDDGSGTFESWDYVYRNLESQGYCKDLGERGDILSQPIHSEERSRERKTSTNRPLKTDTLHKEKRKTDVSSNYYDNVPQITNNKPAVRTTSVSTIKIEKKPQNGTSLRKNEKNRDEPLLPQPPAPPLATASDSKTSWYCKTCTFLNKSSKDICEMCGKSKQPPQSAVAEEIEVGGAECVKCTFVNSKDKKVCVVCGASLNNSPTYI